MFLCRRAPRCTTSPRATERDSAVLATRRAPETRTDGRASRATKERGIVARRAAARRWSTGPNDDDDDDDGVKSVARRDEFLVPFYSFFGTKEMYLLIIKVLNLNSALFT